MKKDLKSILVPVDFQEPSLKAARFGADLARRIKGEVYLVNVIETPGLLADFFSSGDYLVRITDSAKDKLQELASSLEKEMEVPVRHRVERGKPYVRILQLAQELNVRFVILGENHQAENLEQDLGSTVYHVTLKSSAPVLTLKGDVTEMGKKILVPLDLTKETRTQLFSAISYGLNYDAHVTLISTVVAGINTKKSLIYKKLNQARRVLYENGVECDVKLYEYSDVPPFMQVLDYASEMGADLILVMTHQEGYNHDNYIGAFAHHIINLSNVPVLSLTANATGSGIKKLMQAVVDPVGWFKN